MRPHERLGTLNNQIKVSDIPPSLIDAINQISAFGTQASIQKPKANRQSQMNTLKRLSSVSSLPSLNRVASQVASPTKSPTIFITETHNLEPVRHTPRNPDALDELSEVLAELMDRQLGDWQRQSESIFRSITGGKTLGELGVEIVVKLLSQLVQGLRHGHKLLLGLDHLCRVSLGDASR